MYTATVERTHSAQLQMIQHTAPHFNPTWPAESHRCLCGVLPNACICDQPVTAADKRVWFWHVHWPRSSFTFVSKTDVRQRKRRFRTMSEPDPNVNDMRNCCAKLENNFRMLEEIFLKLSHCLQCTGRWPETRPRRTASTLSPWFSQVKTRITPDVGFLLVFLV